MTDTMSTEPSATTSDAVDRHVTARSFRFLIGGELLEGEQRTTTVDPSTGQVLTEVPDGTPEDVDRAVRAAAAAQPRWQEIGHEGRTAAFGRFAELIEANLNDLAMFDAIDSGIPV